MPFILGIACIAALCAALLIPVAIDRERRRHDMPKRTSDYVERFSRIEPGMTYDQVVAMIGPADLKLYGKKTGNRYFTWYIGIKGDGDLLPSFQWRVGHTEQDIDLVFDRQNRLLSKKLSEFFNDIEYRD